MIQAQFLFPWRYQWEHHEHLYQQWKTDKEATEPPFVIENVRIVHDPQWSERFLSIQCARDGKHPVWAFAHEFMMFSLAPPLYPALKLLGAKRLT